MGNEGLWSCWDLLQCKFHGYACHTSDSQHGRVDHKIFYYSYSFKNVANDSLLHYIKVYLQLLDTVYVKIMLLFNFLYVTISMQCNVICQNLLKQFMQYMVELFFYLQIFSWYPQLIALTSILQGIGIKQDAISCQDVIQMLWAIRYFTSLFYFL